MPHLMGNFEITDRTMRWSAFIARFYNLCISYGFESGKIMPSRAFCSDESQGYPIILIAKHFGAFPFNHGRVGGIVATDRHGAHAHHGKDLVIIQASHVGYDPEEKIFGTYRRLQINNDTFSTACGKTCGVMEWYQKEYAFARKNVFFSRIEGMEAVIIDNLLLDPSRTEGLFLHLDRLITMKGDDRPPPLRVFSTSKAYPAHTSLKNRVPDSVWQRDKRQPIGSRLTADLFGFKRDIRRAPEGRDQLEYNLSHSMPQIITSPFPALFGAQANTQAEFDRAYRTIETEPGYQGKNLIFIAGINIDISPQEGQLFPLTKFVPWAAYVQTRDGRQLILEQNELTETLFAQSTENPNKIDLEEEIRAMKELPQLKIDLPV